MRALITLISAFGIGISVAAPVGPIGVLVVQRVIARGRLAGLLTGLGVATADGFYAIIAAFGLSALSTFLISIQTPVRLIGGLFLLYLGIKTLLARPAETAAVTGGSGASDYLSALALTITNPMTILMFAGIFAGAGLSAQPECAPLVVLGVFGGSIAWWLFLTTLVSLLRGRFNAAWMLWVNRISGAVILVFAAISLIGLIPS